METESLRPTTPLPRSGLEKFLDSFLHESSIKWMLVSGAAIIAASSLMLVTRQWSSWPVTLKYLTILSYTAATYGIAEYCGRKLQLQATAQVLRLLTLLLIPIGFLSLSWLTADTDSLRVSNSALTIALLIPATAFMFFACDRIFKHWLQGRQSTFIVAYMLLCLAGALPTINQTWLAVLFSCGFWLVMTLGVVKVNRHIFWLTEEHRWPRIFGFIPVALLGTLMVVLLATKTIGAIELQWLGLGVAMLAATILMTTRTIAAVYRQRTGDLVRPLPWTIIAPLFTGLVLTVAGVLLAFQGFHFIGESTRAVVPTAIVAAGLFLATAKDTRHRGFVWASLFLIAIAYQSTPTLCSELIQTLKATAATKLHEDRLPFAFYGITYLPLLLSFAGASRLLNDRKRFEFSVPLHQFVTAVSILLIAVSLLNVKAACLVSAISFVTFIVYGVLFGERVYILPAIAALLIATATSVAFATTTQLVDCDLSWTLVALATLGLALSATDLFDRLSWLIPHPHQGSPTLMIDSSGNPIACFRMAGQAVTVVVGLGWLAFKLIASVTAGAVAFQMIDWIVLTTVTASLLLWTLRSRSYGCGHLMWVLLAASGWLWMAEIQLPFITIIASVTVLTGVISIASYFVMKIANIDLSIKRFVCPTRSIALLLPLADLALAHFVVLTSLCYLPTLLLATVMLNVASLPISWPIVFGLVGVSAFLFRGPLATSSVVLVSPLVAGVAVGCLVPNLFTHGNLPLIYSVTSVALTVLIRNRVRADRGILITLCSLWLSALVMLGFAYLSPITVASSLISLSAIYSLVRGQLNGRQLTGIAILASTQVILAMSLAVGFNGFTAQLPLTMYFSPACAWMLASIVVATIAFEQSWKALDAEMTQRWSMALRAVGLVIFCVCLASNGFARGERMLIISSLVVTAMNEWRVAVRRQQEIHVWTGLAVVGLLVAWFNTHHYIAIPHGLIRAALVAAAPVALWLATRWTNHPRFNVLVRGLRLSGLTIPFIVASWSVLELHPQAIETLTIFASAMVLFVYGRTHQLKWPVVSAAVMMNVGFGSLWAALSLTDPLFYLVPVGLTIIGLVELLRTEIPAKSHDPLRYIGALAILVSPCVEILGGSWLHLLSLMVLSVLVVLLAIGLRLRALIHTGAAFLFMDLVAMVIRSTIDHPGMLWGTGLIIGAAVIAIAAICENHREQLLSRIRVLSAELQTWN